MCLFTHFAAGALAGGLTGNVWWGAAAGAASHALLDAIPHYDHPDWRLELGGGVFSLILLLLMPFATPAAVVGGLFGMLPDLENLFQKLGKMRRDQFLFPSHTGLIPHGRTLGPRSIGWQVAIFAGCFLLLGLLDPATASAAGGPHASPVLGEPVVRVLQTGPERTRLEIQCPVVQAPERWDDVRLEDVRWGRPLEYTRDDRGVESIRPPRLDLQLAVPTTAPVTARILDVAWWKQPRAGGDPLTAVEFSAPAIFRFVPLSGATIPLGIQEGILRRLVLEVDHAPAGRPARQLQGADETRFADKILERVEPAPPGLLNPELFTRLQRGGRVLGLAEKAGADRGDFNNFDLTGNWLRLSVDQTGLHRLTGQELSNMGLPASSVDPAKLRLYRGGSLAVDTDPEVAEADQAERVGLTEVAIQVLGGDDGEWNLDDEIRFYAYPSDFWLDRAQPGARPLAHYNHPYQDEGVYWLTWESVAALASIPGDPLRVDPTPAAATGGEEIGIARLRRHFEEQVFEVSGVVEDDWLWESTILNTRTVAFTLPAPLADSLATFVIDCRGYPTDYSGLSYDFMANGWINGNTGEMASISFTGNDQEDSTRVRVVGRTSSLQNGANTVALQAANPDREYALMLDSFQIFYWSPLNLVLHSGQLEFTHWREQVGTPGQAVDLTISTPTSGTYVLWDVTDPTRCLLMEPDTAVGSLTCGVVRQQDEDRHFVVTEVSGLHSVAGGALVNVDDLRAGPVDADYIAIYPSQFAAAAQRLTDFRDGSLPGEESPVARAVLVDDIYAGYSGGQKDPYAIRNYLKHVFESGGGNLRFVCLLGNTSIDPRNYKGQDPAVDLVDIMPSIERDFFPQNPATGYYYYPFGTDDPMVSFDHPPSVLDMDFPDVAVGRLPAVNVSEAEGLVDRMIAYASDTVDGLWRNKIMFAADDGVKPGTIYYPEPNSLDHAHTTQAEHLSENYIPLSVDLEKIYGVTYDFPPGSGVKPAMRSDINAALNEGLTMWYYVGHGAENNLADEQIFQTQDIPNLTNGMKRFVFIAFSCDVGVYNSTSRRSMAEVFIAGESGGAIGSICASQVSFINANEDLSDAFFGSLFPERHVDPHQTLAEALLTAKGAMNDDFRRRNSQRFNLLSDPATVLPLAQDNLQFAESSVDTLRSGARQVAVVQENRDVLLGLGDTYSLRVQESAYDRGYIYVYVDSTIGPGQRVRVPRWDTFVEAGSPVFAGSGTMDGSELRVPFKVPAQLKYGERARIRLMLDDGQGVHAAVEEVPAVREAVSSGNDIVGPRIDMAFEDNRYRVKAGTELRTTLTDTSSIAILGTNPGNSILLEFDDSGFTTDVTRSFSFDANSYVSGSLNFPLPGDLAMGPHRAALYASDVLGNVGTDTISFVIVPESVVGMEDVTLFPNPTPGPCRLLMELSDPMLVKWEVYTTAGRRIKTLEENLPSGPQILHWDGRDDQGDEIANGTYIYVLRGQVTGGGERDITKTGKLVIMQ